MAWRRLHTWKGGWRQSAQLACPLLEAQGEGHGGLAGFASGDAEAGGKVCRAGEGLGPRVPTCSPAEPYAEMLLWVLPLTMPRSWGALRLALPCRIGPFSSKQSPTLLSPVQSSESDLTPLSQT